MPWRETDVMDQRIRFVAQALGEGVNFSHLCGEYRVARSTGYCWLNRYHKLDSSVFFENGHADRITVSGKPLTR